MPASGTPIHRSILYAVMKLCCSPHTLCSSQSIEWTYCHCDDSDPNVQLLRYRTLPYLTLLLVE